MIGFRVVSARAEPHAAAPTIVFSLALDAPVGQRLHGVLLHAQLRIEPARRAHAAKEQAAMADLFGEPSRWGSTQRAIAFAEASLYVPPFEGSHALELPIACTYDLELASTKYLHALGGGDVPLRFLFRGTIFGEGAQGLEVTFVPWDREATFALPIATWRAAMDAFFPGEGWLRVRRELLDELLALKARRGLPTWDAVVQHLLRSAEGAP